MPKWSLVLLHIYSVGGKKKKKKTTDWFPFHSLHFRALIAFLEFEKLCSVLHTLSLYILLVKK